MIDWSDYANFSESEMRCRCGCGRTEMDPDFMTALQMVRNIYGRPMPVTSGYRCLEYDTRIFGAGIHTQGKAADISVSGDAAYYLLRTALSSGMAGIGLKQHGAHASRFMHLDTTYGPMRPRVWSYR